MHSKTHYTGTPFLYPAMQSKSIQLISPNNSQTLSQSSNIFEKISFTIIIFPPPFFFLLLAEPLLKPQQFNCILWTTSNAQNNIQIMPYSPLPLKVAQVGNLENIICDLNEVTRRIHQNKTSSEQQPQQKLAVLKLQFQSRYLSWTTTSTKLGGVEAIHIPISLPIPSVTSTPRKQLTSTIQETSCRPTQTQTRFLRKKTLSL